MGQVSTWAGLILPDPGGRIPRTVDNRWLRGYVTDRPACLGARM